MPITKQSKVVDKAAGRVGTDIFGHDVAVGDEVQFQWNYLDGKKQAVSILCTDCVLEEIQFPTKDELNAGEISSSPNQPASKNAASKQASLGTVTQLELIETMKAFNDRQTKRFDKHIKEVIAAIPAMLEAAQLSTSQLAINLIAESSFTQSIADRYGLAEPASQPASEIDPSLDSNCTAITGKGAQCVNPATKGDRCGRHADKPASQPEPAKQLSITEMLDAAGVGEGATVGI